jgi:hypothetical protein
VASLPALGGAIGAVLLDALYLNAIVQQGSTAPGGRVPFVATWIAVAALLAGIGAMTQAAATRAVLLAIAAAAMVTLAVPGMWSIGVPLFICAMAVGLGAARAAEQLRLPWWGVLLAPTLLIAAVGLILFAGFALTRA